MKSIIEDFARGMIYPAEHRPAHTEETAKLAQDFDKKRDAILKALEPLGLERSLDRLLDAHTACLAEENTDMFCYGLRMGIAMVVDALTQPL